MSDRQDSKQCRYNSDNYQVVAALKEALGGASASQVVNYLLRRYGWLAVAELKNSSATGINYQEVVAPLCPNQNTPLAPLCPNQNTPPTLLIAKGSPEALQGGNSHDLEVCPTLPQSEYSPRPTLPQSESQSAPSSKPAAQLALLEAASLF